MVTYELISDHLTIFLTIIVCAQRNVINKKKLNIIYHFIQQVDI